MTLTMKAFENMVGKGENAVNQYFHLFPTVFSTLPKTFFSTYIYFIVCICYQFGQVSNFVTW